MSKLANFEASGKIPVLIMGFNRPEHFKKVYYSIPRRKVSQIFISLDGPRNTVDKEKIAEIISFLELECEELPVQVRINVENLGCTLGVVSALDWFFTNNTEGVVLEDDCVVDEEFYDYVSQNKHLLTETSKIGMITAHNPMKQTEVTDKIVSRYTFINGWYTKQEIWKLLRKDLFGLTFPRMRNKLGEKQSISESVFWWATATRARIGTHDTWDSSFSLRFYEEGFKTLIPNRNLVTNIGFDNLATHTRDPNQSIFIQERFAFDKLKSENFDSYISKNYFLIRKTHAIKPFVRVMQDLFSTRKKRHEEILSLNSAKILVINNST